jgi:5'-3' exonuclease
MDEYIKSGTKTQNLENIMEIYYSQLYSPTKLLHLNKDKNNIEIDIDIIKCKIEKMKRYIFSITPADYELTKILLTTMSIPWVVAPMEAETLCSDLCIKNKVDAVLSEDSDVFAYGNPVTIIYMNIFDETCIIIKYTDILRSLELSNDSFLDFCIMCGSDYNMNIPKIGIERSYSYITQYKSIENFEKYTEIDISNLKLNIVRNYNLPDIIVPCCLTPNYEMLKEFMIKYKISNFDTLKLFKKNKKPEPLS